MTKTFTKDHTNTVKGFAILLLLMYHLFESEELVTSMEVNYSPLELSSFLTITGFGNICVAVFVFLTSFGIAKGLLEQTSVTAKDAGSQALRRFLRLMGNFFILYLSVNILWGRYFNYAGLYGEGKQGILYMVTDALGLNMFFDTPTLNMTWWYMEIAYLLIFLVPLLTWLVRKVGYPVLVIALLAPAAISFGPDLERYLFTSVLGVCAAYGKWPDRMLEFKAPKVLQWVSGMAGLVLCVLIRQNFIVQESFANVADAVVALFLIWFAGSLLYSVPLLHQCLSFLGRHSMNIYLVHTFFYMSLWRQFIYQFHYAWATFLLLLAVTLLYSVVLEFVKKLAGRGIREVSERVKK